MMRRFGTGGLVLVLVLSSLTLSAGGAEITVTNIGEGQVLSTKLYNVSGSASPTPDVWFQNSTADFNEGDYLNVTLTNDEALISDPNVGGLVKDANNPVVDFGANNSYNQMGTILGSILKDGDNYRMWAWGLNKTGADNLGYGTSDNGTGFTSQNGTLGLGGPGSFDEADLNPSAVIKDGGTYKMWYSGQDTDGIWRIGYATSSDGVTWTRGNGGDPVLDLGPVNKFDGGGVSTPCVIKDGGTYKMWFAGMISFSGNLWQVGYATSQNGVDWTKQNDGEPVLSFGKPTAFDKDGLYTPTVIKDGLVYRMWYVGLPDQEVGYATSWDGINWVRMNGGVEVLDRGGPGAWDETAIGTIGIIRDGNDYLLYYTGTDNTGANRVGLAKARLDGMTGVYLSNYRDAKMRATWHTVTIEEDTPPGTTILVETRVSMDKLDWTEWEAVVDGSTVSSEGKFFQYRITFTTPDGIALPTVASVKVDYNAIERVEVSTDNSTWFIAFGDYEWNYTLLLKEGANTLYVRIYDTTPLPTYKVIDFHVDTVKPTGTIRIDDDAKYTTDPHVNLTIAAVDTYGVSKMKIGTSSNLSGVEWQDFSTSAEMDLPNEDGTKTIYMMLQDTTGHESNIITDSIILDMTPPNGTVDIKNKAPMTTFLDVTLSLSATDANGITQMRISNSPVMDAATWSAYAATSEWTLSEGDGEKEVFVEFMDSSGLTRVVSDTIILDTVDPQGTIDINDGAMLTTDRQVTITADASDANDVSHVMLSNDVNFLNAIWTSYNTTLEWTLNEVIGETTVFAKFKDSAGLVSGIAQDTIILDIHVEGFEGAIDINDGDEYTNDQVLKVKLDLVGDDGKSMMMVADSPGFGGATWQPYETSMEFETEAEGRVTLYARFKDQFGIMTEVVSDNITIDVRPPSVTIRSPLNNTKVNKATLEISGSASDDVELVSVNILLPGGQWMPVEDPKAFTTEINLRKEGTHTIKVVAVDEAGNTAEASVTVKYKEKGSQGNAPGLEAPLLLIGLLVVVVLSGRRRRG